MARHKDDESDTMRYRLLWGVWCGVIGALLVSLLVFSSLLGTVRQGLDEGAVRQSHDAWIANNLELDYAGLLAAVETAQVENAENLDERAATHVAVQLALSVAQARALQNAADHEEFLQAASLRDDLDAFLNLQNAFVFKYKDIEPDVRRLSLAELRVLSGEVRSLLQARRQVMQNLLLQEAQSFERREGELQSRVSAAYRSGLAVLVFVAGLLLVNGLLVHELRRSKRATSQTTATLRSVVQASRDAVFLLRRDLTVVGMGQSGEALFGYSEEDTQGRPLLDFFANDRAEFEDFVHNLKYDRDDPLAEFSIELSARRRDGTTFTANTNFAAAAGDRDEVAYIVSVSDMTDQIERELSLIQARNEALQAERAKSRFLASMSHEMRTPLNGVLASLDLLRETTQLDPRQEELISIIERSGDDALEQVENVLELTRLDALANTAIAVAPFSPTAELRSIVDGGLQRARQGNNDLRLETEVPESLQVVGSVILFRQIMHNFLSNALKFTNDGAVTARLKALDLGKEVEFTAEIIDTGVGIESVDLDRIFRNFETIRDSYSNFSSGTGLGLSIAKHSADLLHGDIVVDSTVGEGSTFSLQVRWPKVAAEQAVATPHLGAMAAGAGGALNVLVVEDNEINRQMLVEMLRSKGHTVVEACDGLEGVAAGRDQAFDLILMDISMPKLDGVGATRMLRHMGKSRSVPIVAVTAHSQPEHIREFLSAGMDRVLTKPLRMATLEALFVDLGFGAAVEVADEPAVEIKADVELGAETECAAVPEDEQDMAEDNAPAMVNGHIVQAETPEVDVTIEEEKMTEQLIDKEVFDGLIDMLGGESVVGYLAQFENDAVEMLPKYDAAIAAADFATARAEAHRCAGGAAVIGAGRVHEVLQGMTHSADDADAAKSTELSATLLDLTRQTMDQMKAVIG